MGLKFVNNESVVVDCRDARRRDMQWTLVNNHTMERMDCKSGCDAVEKLRDACFSVKEYLDNLGKAEKCEDDDKYSKWTFYVHINDAPALLNMLDASDHVNEWNAARNDLLSRERVIVRINYTSDRQLLFQEGNKVVFRDDEPNNEDGKEDAQ